jgi:hypothetical protein
VLGQISLAQIQHEAGVPLLQVGHSGFAYARTLLNEVPLRGRPHAAPLAAPTR